MVNTEQYEGMVDTFLRGDFFNVKDVRSMKMIQDPEDSGKFTLEYSGDPVLTSKIGDDFTRDFFLSSSSWRDSNNLGDIKRFLARRSLRTNQVLLTTQGTITTDEPVKLSSCYYSWTVSNGTPRTSYGIPIRFLAADGLSISEKADRMDRDQQGYSLEYQGGKVPTEHAEEYERVKSFFESRKTHNAVSNIEQSDAFTEHEEKLDDIFGDDLGSF